MNSTETRKEVLYKGTLYDVTDFVRRHPGGRIIEMYARPGEDASDAFDQFHRRSIDKVMKTLGTLPSRPAPIHNEKNAKLSADFRQFSMQLERDGYFKPDLGHAIIRITEVILLLVVGVIAAFVSSNSEEKIQCVLAATVAVISLGLYQGRCGWLEHECGHNSFTGIPKVDKMLQTILYGFGDGMSSGWWNNQHNRHHAMPQRLKHDVDLDTLPLMAFTSKIFPPKLKKSFWIQNQAKLFLMIDTFLVALLWKIYLHPRYCIKTRKWTQLGFMALHYIVLMSLVSQPIYWASVWFGSIYIFGNFALSHTHLPVTEADETNHWIEFAFHATTNVSSNFVIDWWMGYLNYQIEHHLFPTMPQFRGPQIKHKVAQFAREHGLPYQIYSYKEAAKRTLANLQGVSEELVQRQTHQ